MFRKIELNQEFSKALRLLEDTSLSVFITGKAGTGKSTLLDYFRNTTKKSIAVLAPTGVAALNVEGQTIHSFFKFKPDITPSEAVKRAKKQKKRIELFKKLNALVIDEISMVRADLLDCVDLFLRTILKKKLPFGGLQMVFIGDLYQLPPVVRGDDRRLFRDEYQSPYFFDAKVMQNFEFEFIELEKVYRQKDEKFIDLLNAIRNNSVKEENIRFLNRCFQSNLDNLGKDDYIYLTTINDLAAKINETKLNELKTKLHILKGEIEGDFDEKYLPTELELKLKEGAQVMFLKNDPGGRWVNGTIGKIKKIRNDELLVSPIKESLSDGTKTMAKKPLLVEPFTWELYETYYNQAVRSIEKKEIGSFTQYPLKLAWAITIHKSQGKTFDKVIIDIGKGTFTPGQLYVALSRCRTLEGIVLKKEIKKSNVFIDWRVIKFVTRYQYKLSDKKIPLEKKIELIKKAIKDKNKLEITYLKSKDVKSKRIILPRRIGEMEYLGYKYIGLEAYCFKRKENRIFRVDKILELTYVFQAL